MTDEEKVKKQYPGAWAYERWRGGWHILSYDTRAHIGEGSTSAQAWADAWRKINR